MRSKLSKVVLAVFVVFLGIFERVSGGQTPPKISSWQINDRKPIHSVMSEKFLSFTIEPAALIHVPECRISNTTSNLIRGILPAYLRVAGTDSNKFVFKNNPNGKPSTELIGNSGSSKNQNLQLTAQQWINFNEFVSKSGLNVVVALNGEIFNKRSEKEITNVIEFIAFSNGNNLNLDWELGYELQRVSKDDGKESGNAVVKLRNILELFPRYQKSLILGPDMTSLEDRDDATFLRNYLLHAQNALNVFTIHPNFTNDNDVQETLAKIMMKADNFLWTKDGASRLLSKGVVPRKPIWIAESETKDQMCKFSDALTTIKRLGIAAKLGASVYLHKPHVLSFFEPTPEYWVAALFKALVGRSVLDIRQINSNNTNLHMFSHCTPVLEKPEDSVLNPTTAYERGSITVYGANTGPEAARLTFKIGLKSEESVHLYVLTEETTNDSPKTSLNKQLLGLSNDGELPMVSPKIRESPHYITLPPHSVFFLVFPNVRSRACLSPTIEELQESTKTKTKPGVSSEELEATDNTSTANLLETIEEDTHDNAVYVSYPKWDERRNMAHREQPKPVEVKPEANTGVKYVTFSDGSWLSQFPEKVREILNRDQQPEEFLRIPTKKEIKQLKMEKYGLLAKSILGKRNHTDCLNDDHFSEHTGRFVRSIATVETPTGKVVQETATEDKKLEQKPDISRDDKEKGFYKMRVATSVFYTLMKKTEEVKHKVLQLLEDKKFKNSTATSLLNAIEEAKYDIAVEMWYILAIYNETLNLTSNLETMIAYVRIADKEISTILKSYDGIEGIDLSLTSMMEREDWIIKEMENENVVLTFGIFYNLIKKGYDLAAEFQNSTASEEIPKELATELLNFLSARTKDMKQQILQMLIDNDFDYKKINTTSVSEKITENVKLTKERALETLIALKNSKTNQKTTARSSDELIRLKPIRPMTLAEFRDLVSVPKDNILKENINRTAVVLYYLLKMNSDVQLRFQENNNASIMEDNVRNHHNESLIYNFVHKESLINHLTTQLQNDILRIVLKEMNYVSMSKRDFIQRLFDACQQTDCKLTDLLQQFEVEKTNKRMHTVVCYIDCPKHVLSYYITKDNEATIDARLIQNLNNLLNVLIKGTNELEHKINISHASPEDKIYLIHQLSESTDLVKQDMVEVLSVARTNATVSTTILHNIDGLRRKVDYINEYFLGSLRNSNSSKNTEKQMREMQDDNEMDNRILNITGAIPNPSNITYREKFANEGEIDKKESIQENKELHQESETLEENIRPNGDIIGQTRSDLINKHLLGDEADFANAHVLQLLQIPNTFGKTEKETREIWDDNETDNRILNITGAITNPSNITYRARFANKDEIDEKELIPENEDLRLESEVLEENIRPSRDIIGQDLLGLSQKSPKTFGPVSPFPRKHKIMKPKIRIGKGRMVDDQKVGLPQPIVPGMVSNLHSPSFGIPEERSAASASVISETKNDILEVKSTTVNIPTSEINEVQTISTTTSTTGASQPQGLSSQESGAETSFVSTATTEGKSTSNDSASPRNVEETDSDDLPVPKIVSPIQHNVGSAAVHPNIHNDQDQVSSNLARKIQTKDVIKDAKFKSKQLPTPKAATKTQAKPAKIDPARLIDQLSDKIKKLSNQAKKLEKKQKIQEKILPSKKQKPKVETKGADLTHIFEEITAEIKRLHAQDLAKREELKKKIQEKAANAKKAEDKRQRSKREITDVESSPIDGAAAPRADEVVGIRRAKAEDVHTANASTTTISPTDKSLKPRKHRARFAQPTTSKYFRISIITPKPLPIHEKKIEAAQFKPSVRVERDLLDDFITNAKDVYKKVSKEIEEDTKPAVKWVEKHFEDVKKDLNIKRKKRDLKAVQEKIEEIKRKIRAKMAANKKEKDDPRRSFNFQLNLLKNRTIGHRESGQKKLANKLKSHNIFKREVKTEHDRFRRSISNNEITDEDREYSDRIFSLSKAALENFHFRRPKYADGEFENMIDGKYESKKNELGNNEVETHVKEWESTSSIQEVSSTEATVTDDEDKDQCTDPHFFRYFWCRAKFLFELLLKLFNRGQ